MPQLEVVVSAERREDVVAGEFRLVATIANRSEQSARLNLHAAAHPALVLEVRNAQGELLLLAPPSPPGPEDLEPGRLIDPGETVTIEYAGFLDTGLPAGNYQVRYFSEIPVLGGSTDDPLRSDWMQLTVRRPRAIIPGVQVSGLIPPAPPPPQRPGSQRDLLRERLSNALREWWRLYCGIERILKPQRCKQIVSQEVDQPRMQTITNAPQGAEAWNGTYGWRARFSLTVDEAAQEARVQVRVRLVGTITAAQRAAWETAIQAAWNQRFALCTASCCCLNGYQIWCDIQFVTSNEHQVVNVGAMTVDSGNWGANDTVGICHEFGHLLGALDEYFTVNGVDWGPAWQPTGSIMNNPGKPPAARHYDTIRAAASTVLGTPFSTIEFGSNC